MQFVLRWLCVLAVLAAPAAHAQVLLETALTLGRKPDAIELPLTLAAGNYRLTIRDFGTPAGPQRLARADVGVLIGGTLVTSASVTAANASGVTTKTFTAAAGSHKVVIIGQPNPPARVGSAAVRIDDPASGAVLLDTLQAFTVPDPPAASPATFERELSVPAGTYTLETTDFALPQALAAMQTTVIRQSDGAVLVNVPSATQVQLASQTAEVYELFVYAELAGSAPHGLVGINLRDTVTGAKQFAAVEPLGMWPYQFPFDVPAAISMTVALNDVQFPFALLSLGAVLVHDGLLAAPKLTGSASTTLPAAAGAYSVYVDARPSASGAGNFGLQVTNDASGARLVEALQSVVAPAPTTDVEGIEDGFDIQTAGSHTLTLTDFGVTGFFDAFTSVSLALTRDSQLVGTPLTGPGTLPFTATPGHYQLAILADPAGTTGKGLLGVRVRGGPGDAIVYDETAAVGVDFISTTFDVAAAQSVDATLTDLGFVGDFDEIKVAVTRGAERVGEIIGAGKFSFAGTPGRYFVNLLATPDAALGYSTLGLEVSVTPPLPAVTLAASATSVEAGGSTTLTWSSTNATACTASGGWTGSRAMSGSTSVGPLSANTSFTLTCTGSGGSDDETVNVTITPQQRSGGGGSADWVLLLLLGLGARGRARVPAAPSELPLTGPHRGRRPRH